MDRSTMRKLVAKQKCAQKKAKLGSGARFKAVEAVARAGGARNPGAVAAMVGRKKHGQAAMTRLSVAARKRGK